MQELLEVDKDSLGETSWSYDCFTTGLPINKESRLFYRNNLELFKHIDNPFTKDNKCFQSLLLQHNKKQGGWKRL